MSGNSQHVTDREDVEMSPRLDSKLQNLRISPGLSLSSSPSLSLLSPSASELSPSPFPSPLLPAAVPSPASYASPSSSRSPSVFSLAHFPSPRSSSPSLSSPASQSRDLSRAPPLPSPRSSSSSVSSPASQSRNLNRNRNEMGPVAQLNRQKNKILAYRKVIQLISKDLRSCGYSKEEIHQLKYGAEIDIDGMTPEEQRKVGWMRTCQAKVDELDSDSSSPSDTEVEESDEEQDGEMFVEGKEM